MTYTKSYTKRRQNKIAKTGMHAVCWLLEKSLEATPRVLSQLLFVFNYPITELEQHASTKTSFLTYHNGLSSPKMYYYPSAHALEPYSRISPITALPQPWPNPIAVSKPGSAFAGDFSH